MGTPNLGYGVRDATQIDAVNRWMRAQPWYQALLSSWGQSPTNVHLSDWQKQQLLRTAQANGIVVDEGQNGQVIDDSGNFHTNDSKNWGKDIAIGAGVGALAVTGLGAAGIGPLSGMFGAADAAAAGVAAPTAAGAGAAAGAAGAAPVAAASLIPGISNGTLFTVGANLFGNLWGAHETASAASDAASLTAAEAKYAADLQAAASANSLRFNEASAENAFQNNEVARRSNYDWQAARERRLGFLGDEVGLPPREVPAFVPGVDPRFGGPGSSASTGVDYQPLIAALNGGKTPQAVIDSFNQSQGLKPGASYAWRSIPGAAGGGVVEIPGGSYLSPTGPGGSWIWSAGDSANAGAPAQVATTQPVGMFSAYGVPFKDTIQPATVPYYG